MARSEKNVEITVGTSVGASEDIGFENFDGGRIFIPVGSSITTITWYDSPDGITYHASNDAEGTALTQTVAANNSYSIPPALNTCVFLKPVGNAAGTIKVVKKQVTR